MVALVCMESPRLHAASIVPLTAGMGLLSLVALRWLGFLGLPPVLFFTLLLAGMPVGGVLLVRSRVLRSLPLGKIALLAAGLSILSLALFLLALQWLAPRVELGDRPFLHTLGALFIRLLLVSLALLPLFMAYGAAEFAAYRTGLRVLLGRRGLVYALVLAGLLFAFGGYRLLLVEIGTSGLLLVGLACLMLPVSASSRRRWLSLAGSGVCCLLLLVPGREQATVAALEVKSGGPTLSAFCTGTNEIAHDAWTLHHRLSMVDTPAGLAGFYDGIFYWFYPRGMPSPRESPASYRRPDLAFATLVQPGDRVAVLGAGGGVQVAAALRGGADQVVAVEVIPEVLEVLEGPLSGRVEHTYDHPDVELVPCNARRWLEDTRQEFDLVVAASLHSSLGGLRDLFEPTQMLLTREAFDLLIGHLAPGGILAFSHYTALDRQGIIFNRVFRWLDTLDLDVAAYMQHATPGNKRTSPVGTWPNGAVHYLILAQRQGGNLRAAASLDNLFRGTDVSRLSPPPAPGTTASIRDDRMLAAGLLAANLEGHTLVAGAGGMALALVVIGLLLTWLTRGARVSQPTGKRCAVAWLVGFNFMAVEYLVVYRLMNHLDIPMDATLLGMLGFTILAATGSILLTRRVGFWLPVVSVVSGAALVIAALCWQEPSLIVASVAALLTGSFFPRLLCGSDNILMRVYAWDAYGALWGGLAAISIPVVAGFSWFQAATGITLLLAGIAVHVLVRGEREATGP